MIQRGEDKSHEDLVEGALMLLRQPVRKYSSRQWLEAYRELARLTGDMPNTDPRFSSVMDALMACDAAFQQDNWRGFRRELERIRQLCSRPSHY
jgi:hypothetical protein